MSDSLGRYLILEEIFSDDLVVVHRAYETMTNGDVREVALKRLAPSSLRSPAEVSFDSLLKTAAFNHPGIARIFDHGRTSKTCFVTTEYVQGHSLRDIMNFTSNADAPPIRVVLLLLRQLCDAINYYRRSDKAGIGRLNLDPATLILGNDGLLRITDTASCFLSLRDESPADLAAVGALAYELLCQRPAPKKWTKEMSPSVLNSACPASLAAIVKKCLTGKFDDAGDVLNALVSVELETCLRPTNEVLAAWHKSLYGVPAPVATPAPQVAGPSATTESAQPRGRRRKSDRQSSRLRTSAFVRKSASSSDRRATENLRRRLPLPPPLVHFASGTPAGGTVPLSAKETASARLEAKRLARGSTSPEEEAQAELASERHNSGLGAIWKLGLAISSALILALG